MNSRYQPKKDPSGHGYADALKSFDGLTVGESARLHARLAECGIDRDLLMSMIGQPRVFAAGMEAASNQRPMTCFADVVREGSGRRSGLRSWLCADEVRIEFFGSEGTAFHELSDKLDRAATVLEAQMHQMHPYWWCRKGGDDDSWKTATGEERFLAKNTIPISLVSISNQATTFRLLSRFLAEGCQIPEAQFEWRKDGFERTDLIFKALADHSSAKLAAPPFIGVELLRFGLLEISSEKGQTIDQIKAMLPPNARLAGLETIAAFLRYPRILKWMCMDPEGGNRGADFALWLLGMGSGASRWGDQQVELTVHRDTFERLHLNLPKLADIASYAEFQTNFVPYVIPVSMHTPSHLRVMMEYSRR